MTKIQIILLFTSLNQFDLEQRKQIKEIVRAEYAHVFNQSNDEITTNLYDAYSEKNLNDIVLAIDSNTHVINEAILWRQLKEILGEKLLQFSYMKQLGFTGKIGMQNGMIKEKDTTFSGDKEKTSDNTDYRTRAMQYQASDPKYSFDRLIISKETSEQIEKALGRILYEKEVFESWGLYEIMPSPITALSFYGAPGTGKSMAADAIAQKLGKKIIRASYADIENKYVGEGPKNVSAIFLAAEEQDAVLFIDEADSLLSKRMVNVSEPSGQAMNSMRSQLLISLEKFHGIVIFATNLAVNYDRAFVSRLINIEFKLPDAALREKIWKAHLYPTEESLKKKIHLNIPLAEDVDLTALAEKYTLCGRDIRNAVIDACVDAKLNGYSTINQECLMTAADRIAVQNRSIENALDHTDMKQCSKQEVEAPTHIKELLADTINQRNAKQQNQST